MDFERTELASHEPLRTMFKEVGYSKVPTDIEARILERLVVPKQAIRPQPALISKKGWYLVVALFTVVLGISLRSSTTRTGLYNSYLDALPISELGAMLTSPWSIAVVAGAVVLTAIDQLITYRPNRALML